MPFFKLDREFVHNLAGVIVLQAVWDRRNVVWRSGRNRLVRAKALL